MEPKAPTADELKELEMAVQVKCVVDASQQHTDGYGLLGEYDEDYFVDEPRKAGGRLALRHQLLPPNAMWPSSTRRSRT